MQSTNVTYTHLIHKTGNTQYIAISCFGKIFLVLAYPGYPGERLKEAIISGICM